MPSRYGWLTLLALTSGLCCVVESHGNAGGHGTVRGTNTYEGYEQPYSSGVGSHRKGKDDGYSKGYEPSYGKGKDDGYSKGYEPSYGKGKDNGYSKGYEPSYSKGYEPSYGKRTSHGKDYANGYAKSSGYDKLDYYGDDDSYGYGLDGYDLFDDYYSLDGFDDDYYGDGDGDGYGDYDYDEVIEEEFDDYGKPHLVSHYLESAKGGHRKLLYKAPKDKYGNYKYNDYGSDSGKKTKGY